MRAAWLVPLLVSASVAGLCAAGASEACAQQVVPREPQQQPPPAGPTDAEILLADLADVLVELTAEVRALREEVAALRREVEALRDGGAFADAAAAPTPAGTEPSASTAPLARGGTQLTLAGQVVAPAPYPQLPAFSANPIYVVRPPSNAAVVRGTVALKDAAAREGAAPRLVPVTRNHDTFGEFVPAQDLLVAPNGGIENAVVWIEGISEGKAFSAVPAAIQARGGRFQPRVQVVAPEAQIVLVNLDPVSHEFKVRGLWNAIIPAGQQHVVRAPARPSIVRVENDQHPWMVAYLFVPPHPYAAVTAADGGFEIADVPPGRYALRIWHETIGIEEREVEIATGRVLEDSLELTHKPK